jgi:hypothetical protein
MFKKFNDYIADRLSYILSMMITFYVIVLLVSIPLFYSQPSSIVAWASYLCSVVFQGIALPVLGYTARKTSDKSEDLMAQMYLMTKKIERMVSIIESQQEHLSQDIDAILDIEERENNANKQ